MSKFMRLMGNEWKKQIRKKGLWIMSILLAVIAVGYSFLMNIDQVFSSVISENISFVEECEWQIEMYGESVDEVDANGDLTDWAKECRLNVEYNQYLLELGITSWDDWRYTSGLVYDAIVAKHSGGTALYEKLKAILDHADTKAYFQFQKENSIAVTENDPELQAISVWLWDYCIANDIMPDQSDWRYRCAQEVAFARQEVLTQERKLEQTGGCDTEKLEQAIEKAAIGSYQLDNGVAVNPNDSMDGSIFTGLGGKSYFWNSLVSSADLISLIGVFSIVIAGSIVANEFSQGTIKFLLINPVKRWKILMSKYATFLTVGIAMMVLLFLISLMGAFAFSGDAAHAFLPSIIANGDKVKTVSPYLQVLSQYLLSFIEVIVMGSLAFALSSLTCSTALSVGVGLLAYFGGSLLTLLLQAFGLDWARYLLFANLDFSAIAEGNASFAHQSLIGAVVIVALHMIVFMWTALDGFCRREV